MGIESYQYHEEPITEPEKPGINLYEKSRSLRSALNEIRSVILSGGLMVILGTGLGIGAGKLSLQHLETKAKAKHKTEMIAKAGEAGGRLFDRFGSIYEEDVNNRIERGRFPKSHEPMDIGAFEARDGKLSAKDIKTIIKKTYPKGWFQNNVIGVKQEKLPIRKSLRKDQGQQAALAENQRVEHYNEGKAKSSIVFDREASQRYSTQYLINNALSHESCHAVEYRLSVAEANRLFETIAERISAPDRYQSEYIENISWGDEKTTYFVKAREYWAEICAEFFDDPKQLNIKDFRIVSEQVVKIDPTFNWKTANNYRKDFVYSKIKNFYATNRPKNRS